MGGSVKLACEKRYPLMKMSVSAIPPGEYVRSELNAQVYSLLLVPILLLPIGSIIDFYKFSNSSLVS